MKEYSNIKVTLQAHYSLELFKHACLPRFIAEKRSTCKRILSEVELPAEHKLVDVKSNPISAEDLAKMYALEGTYEALFNKRAQLYKQRDLKSKNLSEEDYKNLLLEHYTFLKRPVFLFQDQIFVGNAKKNLQELKSYLDD